MGTSVANYQNLRAASDLTAAETFQTPSIPIKSAEQASFFLTATNANALAAAVVEVRKNGGTWVVAAAGLSTVPFGNGTVALNAGGVPVGIAAGVSATLPISCFAGWDEARLNVTGHATLIVAGLAIDGQVVPSVPHNAITDYPTPSF